MGAKEQVRNLTQVELELMLVIWELKEANVREVLSRLSRGRALAYTSVATVLRILEQKGYLKSRKTEKTLVYKPMLSQKDYQARALQQMTSKLYKGSPKAMVLHLLDESDLSLEELRQIRQALNQKLEE